MVEIQPTLNNEIINDLMHRVEEEGNASFVENEHLIQLDQYLSQEINIAMAQHKYVKTKELIAVLEIVKKEIPTRELTNKSPSKSPSKSPLIRNFDENTQKEIEIIQKRAEKRDQNLIEVWNTRMKSRYFIPSPSIKCLREKAQALEARGDIYLADEIFKQADEMEACDYKMMEDAFQQDLKKAREEIINKMNQEIELLKASRKKDRNILLSKTGGMKTPKITSPLKKVRKKSVATPKKTYKQNTLLSKSKP